MLKTEFQTKIFLVSKTVIEAMVSALGLSQCITNDPVKFVGEKLAIKWSHLSSKPPSNKNKKLKLTRLYGVC